MNVTETTIEITTLKTNRNIGEIFKLKPNSYKARYFLRGGSKINIGYFDHYFNARGELLKMNKTIG